jgi:hypothetical protein
MKHHWDTFCTEYLRRLALDVLPKIIEKAIGETLSHSFVVRNEKGEPVV